MHCYTHHERSAVGICKSCGRGLCPECAVEVGDGLSCPGQCEGRVRTMNVMVERNAEILSTSNQALKSAAIFSLVMGVAFLAFGASLLPTRSSFLPYFLIVLGLVFVVNGILRLKKGARYPVAPDDEHRT